jgi:hypothetical protein
MVPFDQRAEGGGVAVQVPGEQLFVRWRVHPSTVSLGRWERGIALYSDRFPHRGTEAEDAASHGTL